MNKSHFIKSSIALACLLSVLTSASAQVVTAAASSLRIDPDTRSGGMGNLGLATSPDAQSGLFNLAKTPFTEARSGLGLNYTPWLTNLASGMYFAEAAGYHRFDTLQALSAAVRFFNLGDVEVTDYSGTHLQTAHPREYSAELGYSRKLSERLGIGVTFRYLNSSLVSGNVNGTDYHTGTAVCADLSLYYQGLDADGQGLSAGFALSNLGTKVGYSEGEKDFLPAHMGLGLAYTFVLDEDNRIQAGVDAGKLLVPAVPADSAALVRYHAYGIPQSWVHGFDNSAYNFSIGAEYAFQRLFFVRAGYYKETADAGGQHYLTAGLGLHYKSAGLDFSYIAPQGSGATQSPMSNSVKFGVSFDF